MYKPEAEPDGHVLEPQVSPEIELIARQELARSAVDAIAEVIGNPVSVPNLLVIAGDDEPSPARLNAKRALRCIEALGRPDSEVARRIGAVGVYSYVEAVMHYGASETKFLDLMEGRQLTPEEVTGLYAVRRLVEDEIYDGSVGFPTLIEAMEANGVDPRQAAYDPEGVVATLEAAGCFVNGVGRRTFDHPIFSPTLGAKAEREREKAQLRDRASRRWIHKHYGIGDIDDQDEDY